MVMLLSVGAMLTSAAVFTTEQHQEELRAWTSIFVQR